MNCHYCKNATGMCDMCRPQRSNTAMTMPSKIWVDVDSRYDDGEPASGCWDHHDDGTPYIRADLAEELARALEDGIKYGRDYGWSCHVGSLLARYKSITP